MIRQQIPASSTLLRPHPHPQNRTGTGQKCLKMGMYNSRPQPRLPPPSPKSDGIRAKLSENGETLRDLELQDKTRLKQKTRRGPEPPHTRDSGPPHNQQEEKGKILRLIHMARTCVQADWPISQLIDQSTTRPIGLASRQKPTEQASRQSPISRSRIICAHEWGHPIRRTSNRPRADKGHAHEQPTGTLANIFTGTPAPYRTVPQTQTANRKRQTANRKPHP